MKSVETKDDISQFVTHSFSFFENMASFFLPKNFDYQSNPEQKVKLGVAFVGMFQALFQVVYLYSIGLPVDSLILASWFLSTLTLLFFLKFFLSTKAFNHLYFCSAVLLILAVNFDAGMGVNPSLMWFCVIPAFSIFMVGMRWGVIYTTISIALSYFSFILAPKLGYTWNEFSDYHNFQVASANLIAGPITFFAIYGYTYWKREVALKALNKERKALERINLENKKLISILFHDMGNSLTSAYLRLSPRKMQLPNDFPNLKNYEIGFKNIELMKELLSHVRELEVLKNLDALPQHEVDLRDMVSDSLATFESSIMEKDIIINLELEITTLSLNKTAFQFNVFNNILSNAIKFTNRGGVVTIKSFIEGGFLNFSIENPGDPIASHIKENLFKISKQATSKGTSGELGSGFGMAIASDVSKKLGGDLDLEDVGGFVKFIFRRPI